MLEDDKKDSLFSTHFQDTSTGLLQNRLIGLESVTAMKLSNASTALGYRLQKQPN